MTQQKPEFVEAIHKAMKEAAMPEDTISDNMAHLKSGDYDLLIGIVSIGSGRFV